MSDKRAVRPAGGDGAGKAVAGAIASVSSNVNAVPVAHGLPKQAPQARGVSLSQVSNTSKIPSFTVGGGSSAGAAGQVKQNPGRTSKKRADPHDTGKAGKGKGPGGTKAAGDPCDRGHKEYVYTKVYLAGRDKLYATRAALDKFNTWVLAHADLIDPAEQASCHICGDVDLRLCEHHLVAELVVDPVVPEVIAPEFHWSWNPLTQLRALFATPRFNLGVVNNKNLAGFANEHISDQMIVRPCYNYVTANMQTSYQVSGRDDRNLRLAHCHRLAMRWVETTSNKDRLMEDTVFKNQVLITVQRACDNDELRVLYGYTDPNENFGLAWLPTSVLVRMLFYLACMVCFVMVGRVVWPSLLPWLADIAAWHYMGTVRTLLLTMQSGSSRLFWSALAIARELLDPLVRVLLIPVFGALDWVIALAA